MPTRALRASSSNGGGANSAEPYVPKDALLTLAVLRDAVQRCKGCDISKCGTRAVLGEGPAFLERRTDASKASTSSKPMIMFVGEQPGDVEEREGHPFVGPAGKILDRALEDAGIERGAAYITNAVKHFKFEARGKRRMHSKPSAREAAACRPWLEREVRIVRPAIVVALGATAAQSLMGSKFRVTRDGGRVLPGDPWARAFLGTVHPSSILRQATTDDRRRAFAGLVADLRIASEYLCIG